MTHHENTHAVLLIDRDARDVVTLTLNRPKVHNAFNPDLITGLIDVFEDCHAHPPRALILTGSGHAFSAGADLVWMQQMIKASEADNKADAKRLAHLFRLLDEMPCPTIARVNGHAFGGGVGLIACCDLAVANEKVELGLTEVRLGLTPATIAPFVLAKMGIKHARRLMLTGERFDAQMAVRFGLITDTTPPDQLDGHIDDLLELILAGSPSAQAHTKALIRLVSHSKDSEQTDEQTAALIAHLRVSEQGQEGLRAFLEKRRPSWHPDSATRTSEKSKTPQ
ncbi:MAG TPA: enoyl-CoA hydratase-related protein, partial [Wenzhouxiangella sp.]